MDFPKKRPGLPGTTPINSTFRNSAYSTLVPPNIENVEVLETSNLPKLQSTFKREIQEKQVMKAVASLPYNVRENILSTMNYVLSTTENFQKNYELYHAEVTKLRNELKKKNIDYEQANKSCEIYRERLRSLEDNIGNLKDNIDSRQKFTVRNKRVIDRLASTNRMLIDSLDALQVKKESSTTRSKSAEKKERKSLLRPMSYNEMEQSHTGPNSPDHEIKHGIATTRTDNFQVDVDAEMNINNVGQNDKLRESLLRVAREHYKSMKNAEILETKVEELQIKLKMADKHNKHLQLEIEEYKASNPDFENADDGSPVPIPGLKKRRGNKTDDRVKSMISRNACDPIEILLELRRILSHVAEMPSSLSSNDIYYHFVSRELCRVFDTDIIVLFVLNPSYTLSGSDSSNAVSSVFRYTSRSQTPETIMLSGTTSVIANVIQSDNLTRVNSISQSKHFNMNIDCCPGVVPKKLLFVPIHDRSDGKVIGCFEFINKSTTNEKFGEFEELYANILADIISPLISCCDIYQKLKVKSSLLGQLLESSTALFDAVPDPESLAVSKSLLPGEVLTVLENVCQEVLKCLKVKAFLVSDWIHGMDSNCLIYLDAHSLGGRGSHDSNAQPLSVLSPFGKQHVDVLMESIHCGVAGHVARSSHAYQIHANTHDEKLNPILDLENDSLYMLTLPICNLQGDVIAVIELIPGVYSPKLTPSKDEKGDSLSFPEASQWLMHQLRGALQYLVQSVGKRTSRPVTTPQRLSSNAFFPSDTHSKPSTANVSGSRHPSRGHPLNPSTSKLGLASNSSTGSLKSTGPSSNIPANGVTISSPTASHHHHFMAASSPTDSVGSNFLTNGLYIETGTISPVDIKPMSTIDTGFEIDPEEHEEIKRKLADITGRLEECNQQMEQHHQDYLQQRNHCMELEASMATLKSQYQESQMEIKKLQENESSLRKLVDHQSSTAQVIEEMKVTSQNQMKSLQEQHTQLVTDLKNLHLQETQGFQSQLQEKNQYIDTLLLERSRLSEEVEQARQFGDAKQEEIRHLHQQFQELQFSYQILQSSMDAQKEKLHNYEQEIEQKNIIVKIMQDQLVSMAGENLSQINAAISKSSVEQQQQQQHSARSGPNSARRRPPDSPPPSSNPSSARVSSQWQTAVDAQGRTYYHNRVTGESKWTLEEPGGQGLENNSYFGTSQVRVGDWTQHFDENGNEYWINEITGESAWELPANAAATATAGVASHSGSSSHTAGGYTIEL